MHNIIQTKYGTVRTDGIFNADGHTKGSLQGILQGSSNEDGEYVMITKTEQILWDLDMYLGINTVDTLQSGIDVIDVVDNMLDLIDKIHAIYVSYSGTPKKNNLFAGFMLSYIDTKIKSIQAHINAISLAAKIGLGAHLRKFGYDSQPLLHVDVSQDNQVIHYNDMIQGLTDIKQLIGNKPVDNTYITEQERLFIKQKFTAIVVSAHTI